MTDALNNMTYQIPVLSMVCMGISIAAALAIPAALYFAFRRKYGCDRKPFWTGCIMFLVFAFVLEQIAHTVVLGSAAGARIQGSLWLYGLYGGLMAGLFEETGRYAAFRTVLRPSVKNGKDQNALMYGAGHGGIEVVLVLGLSMAVNLVTSVLANSGNLEILTGQMPEDVQSAFMMNVSVLAQTQPSMFLIGILERGAAVILHISLSVLVWFAAKPANPNDGAGRRFWLFPQAILLHAAADAGMVILNGMLQNVITSGTVRILLVELVNWILAGFCAWIALRVWKRCRAV